MVVVLVLKVLEVFVQELLVEHLNLLVLEELVHLQFHFQEQQLLLHLSFVQVQVDEDVHVHEDVYVLYQVFDEEVNEEVYVLLQVFDEEVP